MPRNPIPSKKFFLDPSQRDIAPVVGAFGENRMTVKSIDEKKRQIRFTASTNDLDRYNEIVEPNAYKKRLGLFESNPVFCAGHVYVGWSGEPTVIGSWSDIEITKNGLDSTASFATTPLAEMYWQLYRDGHMKAVSVGWLTHAWEMRQMDLDGKKQLIRVFTDVELIEISAVAIPANRQALVQAAGFELDAPALERTTGFDSDALKQFVGAEIRDTIIDLLNTDPGSPLSIMVQETVHAMLGVGGHTCRQVHGPAKPQGEDTGELKKGLKELARAFKT
jgi:HK97 family phage prohead protease